MVDESIKQAMRLRGFIYLPIKGGIFVSKHHLKPENIVQFAKDYSLAVYKTRDKFVFFNPFEMIPTGTCSFSVFSPKSFNDQVIVDWLDGDKNAYKKWEKARSNGSKIITMLPVALDTDFNLTGFVPQLTLNHHRTIIDLNVNKIEWYEGFALPELYRTLSDSVCYLELGASFNNAKELTFANNRHYDGIDFTDFTGECLERIYRFMNSSYRTSVVWRNFNPKNLRVVEDSFHRQLGADISTFPETVKFSNCFKHKDNLFTRFTSMDAFNKYYEKEFERSCLYISDSLGIFTQEIPNVYFQGLKQYPFQETAGGFAFKFKDEITEEEKELLSLGGFNAIN